MAERVNPFLDLGDFASKSPTGKVVTKTSDKKIIDEVAVENGFPSRQAHREDMESSSPRRVRRRTTGRNQQLNIKATAETIALFYRLADERDVPLGELLLQALNALQEKG